MKTETVILRCDKEEKAEINRQAKEMRMSVSEYIRYLVNRRRAK